MNLSMIWDQLDKPDRNMIRLLSSFYGKREHSYNCLIFINLLSLYEWLRQEIHVCESQGIDERDNPRGYQTYSVSNLLSTTYSVKRNYERCKKILKMIEGEL